MRISDWSSDVCSSDLSPKRDSVLGLHFGTLTSRDVAWLRFAPRITGSGQGLGRGTLIAPWSPDRPLLHFRYGQALTVNRWCCFTIRSPRPRFLSSLARNSFVWGTCL